MDWGIDIELRRGDLVKRRQGKGRSRASANAKEIGKREFGRKGEMGCLLDCDDEI